MGDPAGFPSPLLFKSIFFPMRFSGGRVILSCADVYLGVELQDLLVAGS
jgi:hypothetical protein